MLGLVQPMVTLSIIVFEPETRIGEHLQVVQFAAPPPIDGLVCWGLLDGPGGSRKEEGEWWGGGGIFIGKLFDAKSHGLSGAGVYCM